MYAAALIVLWMAQAISHAAGRFGRGDTLAIPWNEIEKEYVETNISQRKLAEKYGISVPALNGHASAGGWVKKKEEFTATVMARMNDPQTGLEPVNDGWFNIEITCKKDEKARQKFMKYALAAKNIPKYDTSDPVHVKNRVDSYFFFCNSNDVPPSPPGLARWLKMTSQTLRMWRDGEYRKSTHQEIIEEAMEKIHEDLVNRLQNGTISPPSGIFLLKNWFGYKDQQDIKVEQKNPLGELQDPEALRKRIESSIVIDVEVEEIKN